MGGGTALQKPEDLFLGFLEGDIAGEMATGHRALV